MIMLDMVVMFLSGLACGILVAEAIGKKSTT